MEEAGSDALWWWRKKPQALELRPPLETGKDEEVDVPLNLQEEHSLSDTLILAQWNPFGVFEQNFLVDL